jgi:hypothetical protein
MFDEAFEKQKYLKMGMKQNTLANYSKFLKVKKTVYEDENVYSEEDEQTKSEESTGSYRICK